MTPEQWKKVNDIFHEVLEHDRTEWPSLLDNLCGNDPVVRQEVASLLATYLEDPDFLEGATAIEFSDEKQLIGHKIGSYQLVRRIGSGGMGEVYLAVRDDLKMSTAIKLIWQGADTETVILAKLEHPNIARLYDAGRTDDGVSYLVMEYVENGRTIDHYCREMPLSVPAKLLLFRKVCAAVHFAHQNQIVHCDLKPKNILVSPDGEPKLLDFGVAAMVAPDSGQARGKGYMTPAYAAPEQCSGETVTTATDIYSLGVLFYELLTDKWPYHLEKKPADLENTEICRLILGGEPYTPELQGARIGKDLQTILMKCLNADSAKRYDSAHGLAEDLRRFTNKEPIIDKSNHFAYVFWLWVCRYKLAVGLGVLGLFLIGTALAWGIYQRAWTREERNFEQTADQIESKLRDYYQLPAQNIGERLIALQGEVDELEKSVKAASFAGAGPGNYALGRAYLAIGDLERAHAHLISAWDAGYREPAAAYYLGRALAELYLIRVRDNFNIANLEGDPHRSLAEAEKLSLQATKYLLLAADVDETEYVQALLAFCEATRRKQDPDVDDQIGFHHALDRIQQVYQRYPWYHEAYKLEGDLYLVRGYEHFRSGSKSEAGIYFQRSEEAYRKAAEIARSAPRLYTAVGVLQEVKMQTSLYGGDGSMEEYFQKGKKVCLTALDINPNDEEAQLVLSSLYTRMAEKLHDVRQKRVYLDRASYYAYSALIVKRGAPAVLQQLGAIHRQIALAEIAEGENPLESLKRAVLMLREIPDDLADYRTCNLLGLCLKDRASFEKDHGLDPRDSWEGAVEAFILAGKKRPEALGATYNLGNTYLERATYNGRFETASTLDFRRARTQFEKVADVLPDALAGLGNVSLLWAKHLLQRGEPQEEQRLHALDVFYQTLSTRKAFGFAGAGQIFSIEAEHVWMNGGDPAPTLARAMEAYNRVPASQAFYRWANMGDIALQRAVFAEKEGGDPEPHVAQALDLFAEAVEVRAEGEVLGWMAEAWLIRAKHLIRLGADPADALAQAEGLVSQYLKSNSEPGSISLILGRIKTLKAVRPGIKNADSIKLLDEAEILFRQAEQYEPNDPELWLAWNECYRRLLEVGQNPGLAIESVDCGIFTANGILSVNPNHAEGHARRAFFLLMKA